MTGRPVLALVVDRALDRHPLEEVVARAVEGGVDWIQLRDRGLPGAAWMRFAESLASAARRADASVRVLVNRRVDVALAIGADGVHLGFDAMSVEDARALLGADARIGVSTHDPTEVDEAARRGADYVHLAPIFDPFSKAAERPALGPAALARACASGVAVLAQGGLDAARTATALAAGAAGIAVTGAILLADDPGEAARRLRDALDAARAEPRSPHRR